MFLAVFCLAEQTGPDARQLLQNAAETSLKTNFIAEVEYPLSGNPIDLEPVGIYYHRYESEGETRSVRLDMRLSKYTDSAGGTLSIIGGKFGKFLLLPKNKFELQGDKLKAVPNLVNDYYTPFMLADKCDFVMGRRRVVYDKIACFEIEMTPKDQYNRDGVYARRVFTIGKDYPFIYCVKNYKQDGSLEDITKYIHTQFKNVVFCDIPDEAFMPPKDIELQSISTERQFRKAMNQSPPWLWRSISTIAMNVIFSNTFSVALAILGLGILGIVGYSKWKKRPAR